MLQSLYLCLEVADCIDDLDLRWLSLANRCLHRYQALGLVVGAVVRSQNRSLSKRPGKSLHMLRMAPISIPGTREQASEVVGGSLAKP